MDLWKILPQRTQEIPITLSVDAKGESSAKTALFLLFYPNNEFLLLFPLWKTDSYLRILRALKDLIL